MLAPPDSSDETCVGVLNWLQVGHKTICYADVQRVAVIQPSIDESLDEDFGGLGLLRQASNKRTQLPELVIASTTHDWNLCRHRQLTVKDFTQHRGHGLAMPVVTPHQYLPCPTVVLTHVYCLALRCIALVQKRAAHRVENRGQILDFLTSAIIRSWSGFTNWVRSTFIWLPSVPITWHDDRPLLSEPQCLRMVMLSTESTTYLKQPSLKVKG